MSQPVSQGVWLICVKIGCRLNYVALLPVLKNSDVAMPDEELLRNAILVIDAGTNRLDKTKYSLDNAC